MQVEILVNDIIAHGMAPVLRKAGIDTSVAYQRWYDNAKPGVCIVEGSPAAPPDQSPGHLFAGEPDARQTDVAMMAPGHGLFRKRYHKLSEGDIAAQDAIKDIDDLLAEAIGALNVDVAKKLGVVFRDEQAARAAGYACDPAGVTLAIRHLEDAVYRAVKALTA